MPNLDLSVQRNYNHSLMYWLHLLVANRITSVILRYNVLNPYYRAENPDRRCGKFRESYMGGSIYHFLLLHTLMEHSFVDILRKHPGPQMSYQVAFCFWLLTFERNIAEEINK